MAKCSCWCEYPNESHKKENGKWKCIDDYRCIKNLVKKTTKTGLEMAISKTVCEKIMDKEA